MILILLFLLLCYKLGVLVHRVSWRGPELRAEQRAKCLKTNVAMSQSSVCVIPWVRHLYNFIPEILLPLQCGKIIRMDRPDVDVVKKFRRRRQLSKMDQCVSSPGSPAALGSATILYTAKGRNSICTIDWDAGLGCGHDGITISSKRSWEDRPSGACKLSVFSLMGKEHILLVVVALTDYFPRRHQAFLASPIVTR